MDDEYIQELIAWTHPHISDQNPFQYTDKENMAMLRLPRKECSSLLSSCGDGIPNSYFLSLLDLPTEAQTHDLYLTLVTLLFSYTYDSRTSQHDPTPESAWTMGNLTPAFTALDPPRSIQYFGGPHVFTRKELQDAVVPSYRRSLTFPLYRSFALAEKCWKDVPGLLQKGKRTIMRCLLEMKDIFDHHEIYYIYSKIWLDDFCVWIQADAK